jgi:cytoskeletal protein RodZ
VAVTGRDTDDEGPASPTPWYNRTGAVVGASALGIVVIGILVAAGIFVTRQFNEPQRAPLNFVEPSFSATTPGSPTPTTTATITSTSPPVTTDIDTPTSSSPTSSSDTSGSTTSSSEPSQRSAPRTTSEQDDDGESAPRTTRRGPRTNVTRTLYPRP